MAHYTAGVHRENQRWCYDQAGEEAVTSRGFKYCLIIPYHSVIQSYIVQVFLVLIFADVDVKMQ